MPGGSTLLLLSKRENIVPTVVAVGIISEQERRGAFRRCHRTLSTPQALRMSPRTRHKGRKVRREVVRFFGSGSVCCLVVGKSRCTVLSGKSVLVTNYYVSCSVSIRASKCMRNAYLLIMLCVWQQHANFTAVRRY